MKHDMIKGYLSIIASAVIFGCMPLGAKLIYADGVNSLTLVFLRNALALPILALLGKRASGTLRLPKGAFKDIIVITFFGCCITPILLFSSYNHISSGTATVLHFIYPAATVLGGILFSHEKAQAGPLACILVCTLGISLFYDPGAPIDLYGSGLALLSGLTYATYIILLSHFKHKEMSGFKFSFYTSAICSVSLLILCLLTGQLSLPSTLPVWGISFLFSFAVGVGAIVLFQRGTFLIGGQRAAILGTFEPITSLIVGVTVFHEQLYLRSLLGSVLVLTSTVMIALLDIRKLKQSKSQPPA